MKKYVHGNKQQVVLRTSFIDIFEKLRNVTALHWKKPNAPSLHTPRLAFEVFHILSNLKR